MVQMRFSLVILLASACLPTLLVAKDEDFLAFAELAADPLLAVSTPAPASAAAPSGGPAPVSGSPAFRGGVAAAAAGSSTALSGSRPSAGGGSVPASATVAPAGASTIASKAPIADSASPSVEDAAAGRATETNGDASAAAAVSTSPQPLAVESTSWRPPAAVPPAAPAGEPLHDPLAAAPSGGRLAGAPGPHAVNGTAPTSKDGHKLHPLMVRQIFTMCIVMYGTIAVLWIAYFSRRTAVDRRTPVDGTATQNEQASAFYVGLLCASWASMSVGMHVLNKSLVSYLQAPAVISAVQMVIAVVVVGFMSGLKILTVPRRQILRWMFVPALFAGMLCSSFYAYSYISLSLLTIIRNLTPLVALPIEYTIMPPDKRPSVTGPIMVSILVMLLGALIYGDGILASLSVVGVAFAVLNLGLAVTDRVAQRRLLTQECKDIPSDVCTIINNAVGLIPTLALAAATHQFTEMHTPQHQASWTDSRILVLLFLSGLVGIGICYLGFVCQRAISATSFFVLQNVSKIVVVSAGVAFFGDPIKSAAAVIGLCLSLGGSFAYGALQMAAPKQPSEPEAAKQK